MTTTTATTKGAAGSAAATFDEQSGKEARPYRMMLIMGAPGAGKTSLVEETIARYQQLHRGNPVVVLDPNAQFAPPLGVWPPDGDAAGWLQRFKEERAKRGNPPGLLVLDDADKYLTGAPPRGVFRDLFTSFRHWRLDVVLNSRRSQDIPKVAIASSQTLALFIHRELYGRQYLAANLGPELVKDLPKERFKYLRVDVDAGTSTLCTTKQRAVVVAADRR